jgi:hypothetical protein
MVSPLSFLNQDNYQTYNRQVAKFCQSVNAAIMLAELINRYEMHISRDELASHPKYGEGWFYYTVEKAEERTCLSRKEQLSALKILKNQELITTCEFGLPNKRYFKVNENKILEIFGISNNPSSTPKKGQLVKPKRANHQAQKGPTAHIYKEPNKEPNEEQQQQQGVDEVVVGSFKENLVVASQLSEFLKIEVDKRAWPKEWLISEDVFLLLVIKYGKYYVSDQLSYITKLQVKYLKTKKGKPIEDPTTYFKLACEKNWATSTKSNE